MTQSKDMTDKVFGHLTAIRPMKSSNNGHLVWECMCICGRLTNVRSDALRRGKTLSCGCRGKGFVEPIDTDRITKEMREHQLFEWWNTLMKLQQDAGIYKEVVDPKWRKYKNFYKDLIELYEPGLVIAKINEDKSYSYENIYCAVRRIK